MSTGRVGKSPKVCPECGSVAIIRLEDEDNCKRCGAKRFRMSPLHSFTMHRQRPKTKLT
jgi:ribosomal protein S27AE